VCGARGAGDIWAVRFLQDGVGIEGGLGEGLQSGGETGTNTYDNIFVCFFFKADP